jgi:hypothetical protein
VIFAFVALYVTRHHFIAIKIKVHVHDKCF